VLCPDRRWREAIIQRRKDYLRRNRQTRESVRDFSLGFCGAVSGIAVFLPQAVDGGSIKAMEAMEA
jgi:hypothetical protein